MAYIINFTFYNQILLMWDIFYQIYELFVLLFSFIGVILIQLCKYTLQFLSIVVPNKKLKIQHENYSESQNQSQNNFEVFQKIKIALDFNHILIQSAKYKLDKHYQKLPVMIKLSFWQKIMSILKNREFGYFYKPKHRYLEFIKTLKEIKNVVLMIYTIEQEIIADKLLQQLKLTEYFPKKYRKYRNSCKKISGNIVKHPALIEKYNTSRMIILTGGMQECDATNGSDRYFLEIKKHHGGQSLLKYAKLLKEAIENNKIVEELHNQLQELYDQRAF